MTRLVTRLGFGKGAKVEKVFAKTHPVAVVAAAAHVLLHLPPLPRHGDGDDEFIYALQL